MAREPITTGEEEEGTEGQAEARASDAGEGGGFGPDQGHIYQAVAERLLRKAMGMDNQVPALPEIGGVSLPDCPRCGKKHEDLTYEPLLPDQEEPIHTTGFISEADQVKFTHAAECPETGNQLFARFTVEVDSP